MRSPVGTKLVTTGDLVFELHIMIARASEQETEIQTPACNVGQVAKFYCSEPGCFPWGRCGETCAQVGRQRHSHWQAFRDRLLSLRKQQMQTSRVPFWARERLIGQFARDLPPFKYAPTTGEPGYKIKTRPSMPTHSAVGPADPWAI